jgi:quercetin dioxygenase-like cupin family protein
LATRHTYLKTHSLSGSALSFSLRAEQTALRERALAARSGRAAKTLVKEGALRATLIALRKGVELTPHRVEGSVSIHVLGGRARFSLDGADSTVASGGLLVLGPGVTHSAGALSNCVFLITVAMPE